MLNRLYRQIIPGAHELFGHLLKYCRGLAFNQVVEPLEVSTEEFLGDLNSSCFAILPPEDTVIG